MIELKTIKKQEQGRRFKDILDNNEYGYYSRIIKGHGENAAKMVITKGVRFILWEGYGSPQYLTESINSFYCNLEFKKISKEEYEAL